MEALCLVLSCLGGGDGVVAVLAVGVEVAILVVMVGLSWTTGFVLFSLRIVVTVDIFVQACRLGLRSGSLIPSFVGWSCRDFFS
jgi:hypothetical protein